MTFTLLDHTHGALHGRVVGDVELHEPGTQLRRRGLPALDAARPDVDGVPTLDQLAGSLASEALVGAGDERHGRCLLSIVLG